MIVVDARGMDEKGALRAVRDAVANLCAPDDLIEVLTADEKTAKKIKAFMEMSGCNVSLERRDVHWAVRMTGRTCICG
jgi:TusA-related sulfurtransferase